MFARWRIVREASIMSLRSGAFGAVVIVAAGAVPGLAWAQAPAPGYPAYDPNTAWGLSNAGVPPGPYVKLGGGGSLSTSSKFDNSYVVGAGVGYRFTPYFRSDVTFDYRPDFKDKALGDARFRNWSAMLNGYIDFNVPPLRPLVPYIGAGAGIAQNKIEGTTINVGGTTVASVTGSSKDQFAWQAMAGISWYFNPTMALDVGYRYFHGGSAENATLTGFPTHSGDFATHEVVAALRFGF
jgi:opacity protein-like surface antigen